MLLLFAISNLWRQRMGRRVLMATFVLLVTLCILSIFLFPGQRGPYPVTHGPVTELRALLPSASLFLALVLLIVGLVLPCLRLLHFEERRVCERLFSAPAPPSLREVFRC